MSYNYFATEKQKKFLKALLLKIKTKNEWVDYQLIVDNKSYEPFMSNNILTGGVLFEDAKKLITALLNKSFKIIKKGEK